MHFLGSKSFVFSRLFFFPPHFPFYIKLVCSRNSRKVGNLMSETCQAACKTALMPFSFLWQGSADCFVKESKGKSATTHKIGLLYTYSTWNTFTITFVLGMIGFLNNFLKTSLTFKTVFICQNTDEINFPLFSLFYAYFFSGFPGHNWQNPLL